MPTWRLSLLHDWVNTAQKARILLVATGKVGRQVQQPLKTNQASYLDASTFTRMAQHHHESLSQHLSQYSV